MSVLNVNQINSQVVGKPPVISDASGLEVGQVCTAWVTFIGTTGAIINSFNVSSVTRTALGQYTVNFTTPMANSGYCATVTNELNNNFGNGAGSHRQSSKTTTQYLFGVATYNDLSWVDSAVSNVQFFGGK